jgi:hypothetical protein
MKNKISTHEHEYFNDNGFIFQNNKFSEECGIWLH